MARIPEEFPPDPEAVIASFAFTDIAEGTGTTIFYGLTNADFGTAAIDKYHLITTQDVFSSHTSTAFSTGGKTTHNFDTTTFNLPRTARGTAYLSIAMGGTTNTTNHVAGTIQKVDSNGTATELASLVSGQRFNGASANDSDMAFVPMPITATSQDAIINKGDFLRLVLDVHRDDGQTDTSSIGHDPQNGDGLSSHIVPGTKHTTVMRLLMPFEIDV